MLQYGRGYRPHRVLVRMRYLGSRSLECSLDSVKRDKVGRVASDEVAYIDLVNISKCI